MGLVEMVALCGDGLFTEVIKAGVDVFDDFIYGDGF